MRALGFIACAAVCVAGADAAAQGLPVSNGFGAAVLDVRAGKVTRFLPHTYASWDEGTTTPNLAFDAFFGVRADGRNAWLAAEPASESGCVDGATPALMVQAFAGLGVET